MSKRAYPRRVVADLLGRSLGADKALETVNTAADLLGVGEQLQREDALRLLEHVAQQQGIVGIAARFAKSRLHLVWGSE